MPPIATIPPPRRTDLILRPIGNEGQYVAKDPTTGEYFNLGQQEFFLLEQLDGAKTVAEICQAFERRFNEPLTELDLDGFLELARSQNFLQRLSPTTAASRETKSDLFLGPTHNCTTMRPAVARSTYVPPAPPPPNGHLDEHERFLLDRIVKGEQADAICAAYERQFGEPLPRADLILFQEIARSQGYLPSKPAASVAPPPATAFAFGAPQPLRPTGATAPSAAGLLAPPPAVRSTPTMTSAPPEPPRKPRGKPLQSLLYWRRSLFDPDRLFNRLAPMLSFIWTPTFVVLSLGAILAAGAVFWTNRQDIANQLATAWNWQTAVIVWLTLLIATTCHEFAHGLTCKRHGGEVHEVGFLLMFFMPCFYCNVSDAWLIREKSKRLWVTLAGGYCDLCTWSLAVFAWRLTAPGTMPNHIAWVVVTVIGGRIIFNFNPLIKLDGYYLLSDAIEFPNLQQRSQDYFKGHLRSLLWGAPTPRREPKAVFLLIYGILSWCFSLVIITVMLGALLHYLWPNIGWLAVAGVGALALLVVPNLLRGLVKGELTAMLQSRRRWATLWILAVAAIAGVMFIPIDDRASGPFQIRCIGHFEARARVAGFVRAVNFDEGDRVAQGAALLVIEVPDLDSRLAQKRAEISEEEAKLALLEAGSRTEEKVEQRKRVERALKWRDLAARDLERASDILVAELAKWDEQIAQTRKDIDFAEKSRDRARRLRAQNSISGEEAEAAERKYLATTSQLLQEESQRRARQAQGTTEAEAELARREKDFADARSALTLLEIGPRSEEVDANRAKLNRMQEELHFLESLQQRVEITSPIAGVVLTPRLKERVGQYVHEGDLIATVEDPALVEAEISLTEQDVSKVLPGQKVVLTSRPMPFREITAQLDRVAPTATARFNETSSTTPTKGETAGSVTVYCQVKQSDQTLRSGMTGYARVYAGKRRIGEILVDRALRYLRTEFWW